MCPLPFRSTFLIDAKVLMRNLKSSKYNEIMDTKKMMDTKEKFCEKIVITKTTFPRILLSVQQ